MTLSLLLESRPKPATTDEDVRDGAAESRERKWVEMMSEVLEVAPVDLAPSRRFTAVREGEVAVAGLGALVWAQERGAW